jgi:hypothetical protein
MKPGRSTKGKKEGGEENEEKKEKQACASTGLEG